MAIIGTVIGVYSAYTVKRMNLAERNEFSYLHKLIKLKFLLLQYYDVT